MINLISLLNIGFSVIIAFVLFLSYLFFLKSNDKTIVTMISCGLILIGITAIQFEHLNFVLNNTDPLKTLYYRTLLFLVPPLFYFFSRFVLFPDYKLKLFSFLHFLPLILVFLVEDDIVIPVAFIIGTGYCLWLSHIIYSLRHHRKRFKVEFFFSAFFSILAIAILAFGFSASFIDNAYFYHFYANGIAFAYMLVTTALMIYPNLLNELTEVVKLSYTTSTLVNVDVTKNISRLEELMHKANMYQNENLNLSILAEAMELTSHQLSELINTQYDVNFSKYIRELRVKQAKLLLKNEPNSSILSISMETGFKSQSNFYAAFKGITGESPGSYRKTNKN